MSETTHTQDTSGPDGRVREAVGVFDSAEALQRTVDDLSLAGFERHELSLMADDSILGAGLGRLPASSDAAKDDASVPRRSHVAPEEVGNAQGMAIGVPAYVGAVIATGAVVATGGTALAAAAAAAVAGAGGGALGTVLSSWLGTKSNDTLNQHLSNGGILLWVNLRNPDREAAARSILQRYSDHPVEVHDIPQTAAG